MLVDGLHDVIGAPAAHLLYLLVAISLVMEKAGEKMTELVELKAWHTGSVLSTLQRFVYVLRIVRVYVPFCPDLSARSSGIMIVRVLSVVLVVFMTHCLSLSLTMALLIVSLQPSRSARVRAHTSDLRKP